MTAGIDTSGIDTSIRARRRLGVVTLVYLARLLAALLVAVPVAGALGATGVAQFANGDAILFEPGAMHLVEALRIGGPGLVAAARSALLMLLMAALFGLLPLAALLVALCQDERLRFADWAGRTAEHIPAFALLFGLTLFAQGAILFVTALLASALRGSLSQRLSERSADLVFVGVLAAGLVVVLAVGVLHDVARAAAVRHRSGAMRALSAGLHATRANARRAIVGWSLPALGSLAIVLCAALIVGSLRVEIPQAARVTAVTVVHQIAAFSIVLLRAVWLATALRLVAR